MTKTLDELMAEYEPERLAAIEADDTPERRARIEAKREAERQRHIALGWVTEDGEPGPNAPVDDEEEVEDFDADTPWNPEG